MSERKVLNKYYPPDFDPSKIPRARQPKNRQFTVRLMAPCNMRCDTCGEYIYKGKKFNARKEDVENETYIGIRIYRFYIKCTRCLQEISFRTDPVNTDYVLEAGATRNFMALKRAAEQAAQEEKLEKEEEATNPMKMLEKRTQASRQEMDVIDALEEIKELNQRKIQPNIDGIIQGYEESDARAKEEELKRIEEEDEAEVRRLLKGTTTIKRLRDESSSDSSDNEESLRKSGKWEQKSRNLSEDKKPTDLMSFEDKKPKKNEYTNEKSIGLLSSNKTALIVRKKTPAVVKKEPSSLSLVGYYGSDSDSS